jgi:predicted nucleotidyltransferase
VIPLPLLKKQVDEHPFPLIFATISGAHLYGFPSPDSDFDLRGAHRLPLQDVIGLQIGAETIEKSGIRDGLEIDLVTHDIGKFFRLMLKKNGYVLEQLFSPLSSRPRLNMPNLKRSPANASRDTMHTIILVSQRLNGGSLKRKIHPASSRFSIYTVCC